MCGLVENDIDYWTRLPTVKKVPNTSTLDACRTLCFEEPHCMVWSLDIKRTTCFLMELEQNEYPLRRPSLGFISGGLPCNQRAIRPSGTLYCFALMQPEGYERDLLAMQYQRKISLFSCDEYAIYSNKAIEVAPGVTTGVVDSTLKCDIGGEFNTALNLDIFVKVWQKVVTDGRFLQHDWTVKVDPDCVFFPDLLRSVLPHHPEVPEGVYLNNCKYGLHGPIEVFSRNAVKAWYSGMGACQDYFTKLCSGFCGWGEDMFIDQCLMKVVKSRRDNNWSLLTEDHCPKDPDEIPTWTPMQCSNGDLAFHPFKTQESYLQCLQIAMQTPVDV